MTTSRSDNQPIREAVIHLPMTTTISSGCFLECCFFFLSIAFSYSLLISANPFFFSVSDLYLLSSLPVFLLIFYHLRMFSLFLSHFVYPHFCVYAFLSVPSIPPSLALVSLNASPFLSPLLQHFFLAQFRRMRPPLKTLG